MAKGQEIVSDVVQKVVRYIETPRELRKAERARRRTSKEPWLTRWFGLIPMSLTVLYRQRKRSRRR